MDQWTEFERKRLLEFERKLEEGGVIAYSGEEGNFTVVLASGFVMDIQMYFYPEGPFFQVNDEYPY